MIDYLKQLFKLTNQYGDGTVMPKRAIYNAGGRFCTCGGIMLGPILCDKCQEPAIQPGFKRCKGCDTVKPLSEWYWVKAKCAYSSRCKECEKAAVRARYRRQKEATT